LGLSYNEQRQQGFSYKGYIAENVVQSEWVAQGGGPTYSWEYARSEIEFIVKSVTDALIPIEVKSGKRTRTKSLGVYVQRYSPQKSIKLVGSTRSEEAPRALVLPLYFALKVRQLA
jgi:predicted AAA+ superfamily ATPase